MFYTGFEPVTTKTVNSLSTDLPLDQEDKKQNFDEFVICMIQIVLMINTHMVDQL